jgi:hypothetical protein
MPNAERLKRFNAKDAKDAKDAKKKRRGNSRKKNFGEENSKTFPRVLIFFPWRPFFSVCAFAFEAFRYCSAKQIQTDPQLIAANISNSIIRSSGVVRYARQRTDLSPPAD